MKKLVFGVISILLATTMLVSCSKSPSSTDSKSSDVDSKKPKVELTMLTWHGPDSATTFYKGYEQIAKDYTKDNPNVKIDIRYEADSTFGSILETGFAGGTAPDIIQMKSSQRLTYKNDIMNLRPYLMAQNPHDTRNPTWAENFTGGIETFPVEEGGGDNNSLLFVPNDGNPEVFSGVLYIYNKALIKEAGLDPEKTPETWTDMFKWLEAIKTTGKVDAIAGSNEIGVKLGQIGFGFGEDYDSKFFDDKYNDPEFINDLYWDKIYILTCYDKGNGMPLDNLPYYPAQFDLTKQLISYYQTSWPENSSETETLTFASGKSAMMTVGSWDYGGLTSSLTESKFPEGFGSFRIPHMGEDTLDYAVEQGWTTKEKADAAKPFVVTRPLAAGGTGQQDYGFTVNKAVEKDEEKLKATIDFLQYLSSYEVQKKYVEIANSFSPIKDVPVPATLDAFVTEEPEGGWAKRVLGIYAVEWGISDWPVEMMKWVKGETDINTAIKNVTAPTWVADIPSLETLESNIKNEKEALAAATEENKEQLERNLKYAQLRRDIFSEYYYNKTGDLKQLR